MIINIGASGFIGENLYKYFINQGIKVVGTYNHNKKNGLIYFDIESQRIKDVLELKEFSYAIICSAITGIDYCRKHEKKSYNVNVVMTKKLIKDLFDNNIIPIFISTEYVFDGLKGNYKEGDRREPKTVYGSQKKQVEDYLFQSKKKYMVIRLSKAYGLKKGDNTMLTDWAERLNKNETITCISDQKFSATYVGDITRAIHTIIKRRMTGLYHITNSQSYNRVEMALMLKKILGITKGNIKSKPSKSFGFLEEKPLKVSLNSEKFINETGFKFTKLEDNIRKLR